MMESNNLNLLIQQNKPLIDREIEQELENRLVEAEEISPEIVKVIAAMKELSVGGKRLRGLLTILGYQLAGGKINDEVVKAAVVMELFHLGLLIQDDVMDRDGLRRGVKTIHARYADAHLGESLAICAGDLTFGWGMEILSNLQSPITNNQKVEAIGVWGKYFARVGYGQMLDVSKVADEATLLSILNLKSGEYTCVLPLLFGATLGGASETLRKELIKYGMELGWVFQLRDDYLAEYGDSAKTGKPVGNDSREGKKTLATMYGRERLEAEIKGHWEEGKKYANNEIMQELLAWVATRYN